MEEIFSEADNEITDEACEEYCPDSRGYMLVPGRWEEIPNTYEYNSQLQADEQRE